MDEKMVFVREQGSVEYDIMYVPKDVERFDMHQFHNWIRETLGRGEEITKVACDNISIRNVNSLKYLLSKEDAKIEVIFEGKDPQNYSNQPYSNQTYNQPYSNQPYSNQPSNQQYSNQAYSNPNPPNSYPPPSSYGQQSYNSNYSNQNISSQSISSDYNSSQSPPSDNKWLTVLDKNPFAFGHSGTVVNEHLLVFGGFIDEDTSNTAYLLSDIYGKFSKLRVRGDVPEIRERHTATLVGKRVYIIGGYCRSGEVYYNNIFAFETETLTWTALEPGGVPPEKRCGHSASVIDGKIWVFGGRVKVKKGGLLDDERYGVQYRNDLYCYDPVPNEWYRYEPSGIGPSPRSLHSAVVVGRKVYVFGGANSSGTRDDSSGFCDLYELSIDTMSWKECETQNTPPSPCYGNTATYIGDNKILFFGGKGYKVLNTIHILDLNTMSWHQFAYAGNQLATRWGHTATFHENNRVVLYGGRDDEGYLNSIETILIPNELIELKPDEQAKEDHKKKSEEKKRLRETMGNLQNTAQTLQEIIIQMGEQVLTQKRTLTESRKVLLGIKQENEMLKRKIALAKQNQKLF